jgi:prepilin-type N-terminal cleavage/methylation domain-containing protein/prepilin-type processing-associated H-X9-DG protein
MPSRRGRFVGNRYGVAAARRAGRRGRASAFTLIELLVVISIISLLVSILMPSVFKARRLAERAVCLTHLHGVGMATMVYAADNKDYIPWGNNLIWFQALIPYLGSSSQTTDYRNVRIYRCPSFPDKKQTVCFVASSWKFSSCTDQTGYETEDPRSLKEFDRPSLTLFLADNENGSWRQVIVNANSGELERQDVWNPGHLPTSTSTDWTYGRRVAAARHADGSNGTFLDGHSAWTRSTAMTVNMWRDKWFK